MGKGWKLTKATPLNKGLKKPGSERQAGWGGVSFAPRFSVGKGGENNLLGDVMVCSFNHVDHPRSLTEAKFWPVYGGRNWGRKESFRIPPISPGE